MEKTPKELSLVNFKKARTHIDKIVAMIEQDKYCIDIMQQNLAVIGLLRSAHQMLMEGHLKGCFRKALDAKSEKKHEEMVEEILKVTRLYNK